MTDESMKELIDALLAYQEQFTDAIEQFEAGVFPKRCDTCFEMIYKQAFELIEGDFHETYQQYIATIATSAFEQVDVVTNQFVDGDSEAFRHSSMWLSIFINRHLFPLASPRKWSELLSVVAISMLVNSVSSVKESQLPFLTDELKDLYLKDYDLISAAQLLQLAQISKHEEITDKSPVDIAQRQASEIKSRDARRTVSKRWAANQQRVVRFDLEHDPDSPLSKNEQARRFLKKLPDEQKPKGDNQEAHVRSLVNAHRRYRKKWEIGED